MKTDTALVDSAQAGDKAAFNQLIDRHHATVLHLVRRTLGNGVGGDEPARDLTQEALLHAYLSLGKLRDPARFRSWLCGIALNLCRSYLRSHKTRLLSWEALQGGVTFESLPFQAPGPQEALEALDLHRTVLAAIDELSPRNREAVLLFYFEGLRLREIAALLGISLTAVKSRLHKSRLALRESLAPVLLAEGAVVNEQAKSTQQKGRTMIEVKVADVVVQESDIGAHNVVILLDEANQRFVPIWIGDFEGTAIAFGLRKQTMLSRPLTYTFMAQVLNDLGAALARVEVVTLQENTYLAQAHVRRNGQTHTVDARPSDAIALAVQTGAPIYVADEIMQSAGVDVPEGKSLPIEEHAAAIVEQMEAKMTQHLRKVEEKRTGEEPETSEERYDQAKRGLFEILFEE